LFILPLLFLIWGVWGLKEDLILMLPLSGHVNRTCVWYSGRVAVMEKPASFKKQTT
jgi:hypothetical protein